MALYVATIAIEVEESCDGRKPDEKMVNSYLENRIKIGEVKEDSFRRKISLNISEVNISVMNWGH